MKQEEEAKVFLTLAFGYYKENVLESHRKEKENQQSESKLEERYGKKKFSGIVVFSINEEVLKQICNKNSDGTENVDSMNFIVDEMKHLADRKNSYEYFVAKTEVLKGKNMLLIILPIKRVDGLSSM